MNIKEDIIETFTELVSIDSPSLKEKEMAKFLKGKFEKIGIKLEEDDTGVETLSNTGNLYAYVSGETGMAPIILSAHMDTVNPAINKKAVFDDIDYIKSNGDTVLGADDLAGVTEIYQAIKYIKENKIKHRDFEILFSTGEELYCKGAKAFDLSKIKSTNAYVFDLSGEIGRFAYAAPTILSFKVIVKGKAAHAGFAPEEGINAIAIAARAISKLKQGHIDRETTANIGTIKGGTGVNIVPDICVIEGEIRSLKHEKALQLAKEYENIFKDEAKELKAQIIWNQNIDIKAYETCLESDVIKEYKEAANSVGLETKGEETFGGSDCNVFANNGISSIVVANSMYNIHSCEEYSKLSEIEKVTELIIKLLTLSE